MQKFEEFLYKVASVICQIFMVVMTLIVIVEVFGRIFFNHSPAWGNELAIACMLWLGLVASALAEKEDRHIRIKILDSIYPKKMVRVLHLVFYFLKIVFAIIIAYNSYKLVIFNRTVYMASAMISQSWVSLAGVFMGVFTFLFLICRFKREVFGK